MLFPLIHEFQQLLPNMEVPNNCSVHKDLMLQTCHCSYPAYPPYSASVVSIDVIKIVTHFPDSPLFPSPCLAMLCKDSSNPGVVTKDRHGWKQFVVYSSNAGYSCQASAEIHRTENKKLGANVRMSKFLSCF